MSHVVYPYLGTSSAKPFAGLIVLVLDIVVIISVLAGKGTIGHEVLWSLIVILLPLIGLILYFVLGRNRADRPLME